MDAEESELAGALVGHNVDDFKAGEEVVLTLADERVLVEDGNSYQLNDKEEMLENVNMVRASPLRASLRFACAALLSPPLSHAAGAVRSALA
eukprot:2624439-Prymnesium_polylepis.1